MVTLTEGQKAPAFSAKDQNGEKVSLSQFKGQRVVLYFYPEDDTPTCTDQACNLRDNFAALQKEGIVVLGVSPDEVKKHKKFETKYNLPYRLIADEDHTVINTYDVWGKKQFMGKIYDGLVRTSFVINEKGIITGIVTRVLTKKHTQQILDTLQPTAK